MGRRRGYGVGFVALAMLLAGCAGRGEPAAPSPPPPENAAPVIPEPTTLIGSWTVTGADVATGTVLRLAGDGLSVFRECDVLFGEWRADPAGLFLGDVNGTTVQDSSRCSALTTPRAPEWLTRVSGFRAEGPERVLLDDRGEEVVRLRPGARPSAGPNLHSSQVEPPAVTDEARRRLAPVVALPRGLAAVTPDALVGRWVPAAGPGGRTPTAGPGRWPTPPHVELASDGTWEGSDGCNGTQGRWATGPDGALLATGGVSTLIGCDNVPVGTWLITARRAGLDGDVLVLLDAAGVETGRLRRG